MKNKLTFLAAAIALFATMLLAGCGGDDSGNGKPRHNGTLDSPYAAQVVGDWKLTAVEVQGTKVSAQDMKYDWTISFTAAGKFSMKASGAIFDQLDMSDLAGGGNYYFLGDDLLFGEYAGTTTYTIESITKSEIVFSAEFMPGFFYYFERI